MPPLQWHETFEDPYSCSITGYKEGLKKLEEIGKEEVNKLALSITFSCRTYPGANTWFTSSIMLNYGLLTTITYPLYSPLGIGLLFNFVRVKSQIQVSQPVRGALDVLIDLSLGYTLLFQKI